jgi:hypothetical protein
MKTRFQSLPFKCNLQRYTAEVAGVKPIDLCNKYVAAFKDLNKRTKVGLLHKLNPVNNSYLESAWLQPLNLYSDLPGL